MGDGLIWDQHSPACCQDLGMILEHPEHSGRHSVDHIGHTVNLRHHQMETLITVQQDTKQIIALKTV